MFLLKIKRLFYKLVVKLKGYSGVYYINGSQTLPPPLSTDEENEVIKGLAQNAKQTREKLIVHNLRLVVYIAKKFDTNTTNVEDLISIGTIGLIKAVKTYSPEKNIKLATYASRCIENEILMYLRKNSSLKSEISFNEPLNVDWDGNELLLSDILGSDTDEISRGIEQEDEKQLLKGLIDRLSSREKQIMQMRFGLGGYEEYTQKQVADCLGISQSYISRLEKRIIEKLKKQLERA